MATTSHVPQIQTPVLGARQISYPLDTDTFQWSDPPAAMRSPQQAIDRNKHLVRIIAHCSFVASTDTTFEVLVLDRAGYPEVDLLSGRGILPAGMDEVSLLPVLQDGFVNLVVQRHRMVVNLVTVGTGLLGFIVTLVYK